MSIEQAQAAAVGKAAPDGYRVCRIGTFYWKLPEASSFAALPRMSTDAKRELVDKLCQALERDSRVVSVRNPAIEGDYSGRKTVYPDSSRTDPKSLLTVSDGFEVIRLSDPILLHAHVPIKNQPQFHGNDDIPTEDYFVSWDGVTVVVLWRQPDDNVPLSGGHVITDILRGALDSWQAGLYVQACSPECDNQFFHTVVLVRHSSEAPEPSDMTLRSLGRYKVEICVPMDLDDFDILTWMDLNFGLDSSRFAEVKNLARRVMDTESLVRDLLTHLLGHYYEHASTAIQPWWRSLRKRWGMRGWRREARQILASLWLALAHLEDLRRLWGDSRHDFEESSTDSMLLFEQDYSGDAAAVQSLEVGRFDATVEQIAHNLENRAVVLATVGGALAGGLAGALVGLIH